MIAKNYLVYFVSLITIFGTVEASETCEIHLTKSNAPDSLLQYNRENRKFYDHFKPIDLISVAEKFELNQLADLVNIESLIKESQLILEVGGGTGRVVDGVLQKNLSANMVVLEPSPEYFKFLKDKYKNDRRVNLEPKDVIQYKTSNKFDLVTWMWSGILDLNPEGQQLSFQNLALLLAVNGRIVIDVPHFKNTTAAVVNASEQEITKLDEDRTEVTGKWREVYSDDGTLLMNYLPSPSEMAQMAISAGLRIIETKNYMVSGRIHRTQYVLGF